MSNNNNNTNNNTSNNLINFKIVGNEMITNPLQFPINSTDDITQFLDTHLIPNNLPILTDTDTLNYITKETLESLINSLTQLLTHLPVFPARPALEWTKNVENEVILKIIEDYIKNCQHLNEEAQFKESTKRADEINKLFDEKLKNSMITQTPTPIVSYPSPLQPPPPPPPPMPTSFQPYFSYVSHPQNYQCQCQYLPNSSYCYPLNVQPPNTNLSNNHHYISQPLPQHPLHHPTPTPPTIRAHIQASPDIQTPFTGPPPPPTPPPVPTKSDLPTSSVL
ncbi:hypothetical protein TCON_2497 [Astathelohania contejeani]|uniref:Uncharacterized protein n=1 Tax=Astathelohania contejeani TaxID=164912 RepID=A0ABQ7HVV5_9MICR|nr:hypothetical protein TCON_2497 [Thelohania contejeani]